MQKRLLTTTYLEDDGDSHYLEVDLFHGANDEILFHCTIDHNKTIDIHYVGVDDPHWEDIQKKENDLALKLGSLLELHAK